LIALPAYEGVDAAVMGLGRSGLASAEALAASRAHLHAWDDEPARREQAAARGLHLDDLHAADWSVLRTLVWSPGIPHTHPHPHPVFHQARRAGCEALCDIELLYRSRPEAHFIGVTGTNGKSTVTALLGHLLCTAGFAVEVGGNLGPPALGLAPLGADGHYVLELSSYQLELLPTARFGIAVFLNVSPDHLDRHGGMHGYVAAKERIFRGQGAGDVAVVGVDDAHSRRVCARLAAETSATVVPVSAERDLVEGVSAVGGMLRDRGRVVADLRAVPTLPGAHNWQNAAAAYAAARAAGVPEAAAAAALSTYPGLPHRQELVATIDGVRFVNDSKATNAESTAKALASYETIYWIAGGLAKEGGIGGLAPWFGLIAHAFLIGQAASTFAETLGRRVPWTVCGDLATAVRRAAERARAERRDGAVVLLSPACASFDQWPNFEVRGDAFRRLVRAMADTAEAAP